MCSGGPFHAVYLSADKLSKGNDGELAHLVLQLCGELPWLAESFDDYHGDSRERVSGRKQFPMSLPTPKAQLEIPPLCPPWQGR